MDINDIALLAIAAVAIVTVSLIVIFGRSMSRPRRMLREGAPATGAIYVADGGGGSCADGGGGGCS